VTGPEDATDLDLAAAAEASADGDGLTIDLDGFELKLGLERPGRLLPHGRLPGLGVRPGGLRDDLGRRGVAVQLL
jgi:hypothetical protein